MPLANNRITQLAAYRVTQLRSVDSTAAFSDNSLLRADQVALGDYSPRWCGPGDFTPTPTPNRTCKFPSHPALQTALIIGALQQSVARGRNPLRTSYATDVAATVPTIFFGPLPRSSRTLPISEPFRCPKRHILPPFAMWLAFPTSDYYDGSATRLPHR